MRHGKGREVMVCPGQIAYEAYFKFSGGVSLVSGAPLPTWGEQDARIREAWNVAAQEAIDVHIVAAFA